MSVEQSIATTQMGFVSLPRPDVETQLEWVSKIIDDIRTVVEWNNTLRKLDTKDIRAHVETQMHLARQLMEQITSQIQ